MTVLTNRVAVIGAGIGGLAAAVDLARNGVEVVVFERADAPGGKIRQLEIDGARLDAGPTVFTKRSLFEKLFEDAGARLSDHLTLRPLEILARHAWNGDERLDLYSDIDRTADAIGEFSGSAEARRYRMFCQRVERIHRTLEPIFLNASKPSNPLALMSRAGPGGWAGMCRISPYTSMWQELGKSFRDPRLQQLFGRYATYCGSSPYLAPATLMLIAHVEREGVWTVDGGMHALAEALAGLAQRLGAKFRYGAEVTEIVVDGDRARAVKLATGEQIAVDATVVNADVAALGAGMFGADAAKAVAPSRPSRRSLSAMTWSLVAETEGFPLLRHNVFFSGNYAAEFDDMFKRHRMAKEPTIYVCAQTRGGADMERHDGPDRLLCVVNAPATGDRHKFSRAEIEECENRAFKVMENCGLRVHRRPERSIVTTPTDFERLFPATGGALYGQTSHGWMASFQRPGSRTRIPGIHLAGGSTHPGPGVPMAALSGRLAAADLLAALVSTRLYHKMVTSGGMSMPSATMGAMGSR